MQMIRETGPIVVVVHPPVGPLAHSAQSDGAREETITPPTIVESTEQQRNRSMPGGSRIHYFMCDVCNKRRNACTCAKLNATTATLVAAASVNRLDLPHPVPPEIFEQIHAFAKPRPPPPPPPPAPSMAQFPIAWQQFHYDTHVRQPREPMYMTRVMRGEEPVCWWKAVLCCCPCFRFRWVQNFGENAKSFPRLLGWTLAFLLLAGTQLAAGLVLLLLGGSSAAWLAGCFFLFFGSCGMLWCPFVTWFIADDENEDNDAYSALPRCCGPCFFGCYGITNGPLSCLLMWSLCNYHGQLPCDTSSL